MSRSRTLAATSARLLTARRVPPPVFRWARRRRPREKEKERERTSERGQSIRRRAPEPPPLPPASCQLHRSVTDGFSRPPLPLLTTCSPAVSAFDGRNSPDDYAAFGHPGKQLAAVRPPPDDPTSAERARARCSSTNSSQGLLFLDDEQTHAAQYGVSSAGSLSGPGSSAGRSTRCYWTGPVIERSAMATFC